MDIKSRIWYWLFLTLALLLVLGCRLFGGGEKSPAPGCNQGLGGGCFGRTVIQDLVVEPEVECLRIKANNCNGGVIETYNGCESLLVLGDHEIEPGDYPAFDLVENGDGSFRLVEVDSNFSEYMPVEDKQVTITGFFDDRPLTITFTKTAPLCEAE